MLSVIEQIKRKLARVQKLETLEEVLKLAFDDIENNDSAKKLNEFDAKFDKDKR